MAGDRQTLIIDAQILATKKLDAYHKQIEKAGGKAMLKLIKETTKAEREMKKLGITAEKSKPMFGRFSQGITKGIIVARAFEVALKALNNGIKEIGKSVLVAARIKALGRVYEFTGKKAGFTADQLAQYRAQLVQSGIAEREAIGVLQRGIQARFDLNKVVNLGRIAQNAAFVAGVNSSDAHRDLMDAIVKQRPILLKQFGILVNLNAVYGEGAKKLGVKKDALSATQRREILYNEVVKQSATIQGAYVEGMKEVGKRLTSLPRHYQAAQNALGQHFVPALGLGVDALEGFLKAVKNTFQTLEQHTGSMIQQSKAMKDSQASTLKLAAEYDTLAIETKRTTEEQGRMVKILAVLERVSPDVITAWDDQGVAIAANTTMLRANLEAELALQAIKMKESLRDAAEKWRNTNLAITRNTALLAKRASGAKSYYADTEKGRAAELRSTKRLVEALGESREKQKALVTLGSIAYPLLKKETDRWNMALDDLGKNLAEAVVQHQKLKSTVGSDPDAAVAGPDLSAVRKAEKARAQIILTIRENTFENLKIGKTEHQQEMMDIEREYNAKNLEVFMNGSLSLLEAEAAVGIVEQNRRAAKLESHKNHLQQMMVATKQNIDDTQAVIDKADSDYKIALKKKIKEYRWFGNTMKNTLRGIADGIMDNSRSMKEVFENTMKAIGKALVYNLINLGVNALINYMATAALMKASMVAEGALVKTLTLFYVSLAAAKAAASLGATTAKSIGAATATKAALTPILAFDNPINDSFARKSGTDFGRYFMNSLADTLSPPDFGRDVSSMLEPTFKASIPQSGGGLTIHFNGNVMTDEFVHDVVIPEIQNAYRGGQTNVIADSGFVNGEPDVSI